MKENPCCNGQSDLFNHMIPVDLFQAGLFGCEEKPILIGTVSVAYRQRMQKGTWNELSIQY